MNNYLIYKHTSPSGKAYIGQTNNYNKRCNQHQTRTVCRAFHAAIKRYTWDAFTHEILHENLTLEQANELESLCIDKHNTLSPNGYNLATGGLNSKRSLETKAKMSLAAKGKIRSPEHRANISLAQKGKIKSPKTKAKMSLAKKGKIKLPEHIANVILGQKATTFEKLKQHYLQATLTEDIYSARKIAEILNVDTSTIISHLNPTTRNHLGHFIIQVQHIHDFFNQQNPYITL